MSDKLQTDAFDDVEFEVQIVGQIVTCRRLHKQSEGVRECRNQILFGGHLKLYLFPTQNNRCGIVDCFGLYNIFDILQHDMRGDQFRVRRGQLRRFQANQTQMYQVNQRIFRPPESFRVDIVMIFMCGPWIQLFCRRLNGYQRLGQNGIDGPVPFVITDEVFQNRE